MAPEDDNKLPDRVLRIAEVEDMVGMSEATIWREIQTGQFPPALRLSARCRGWRLSDLLSWLATRPPAQPP